MDGQDERGGDVDDMGESGAKTTVDGFPLEGCLEPVTLRPGNCLFQVDCKGLADIISGQSVNTVVEYDAIFQE